MKDPAAVALGRKGGKSTSPAKQAAVRANVKKARVQKFIDAAKKEYGPDAYLGRQEFCPNCIKLVYHIRGIVPRCSECGAGTNPIA